MRCSGSDFLYWLLLSVLLPSLPPGALRSLAQEGERAALPVAIEEKKKEDAALREAYRQAARGAGARNERELAVSSLRARREQILEEINYIRSKIEHGKKKYVGKEASNFPDEREVDKWQREIQAWEARLANAKAELGRIAKEETGLVIPDEALRTSTDMVLPGETLELFVNEDNTLNDLYQVRRGGYIVLPRVGRVAVAGKTIDEVEAAIKARLEEDQLRQATVLVEREDHVIEPQMYQGVLYLAGEFRVPGPWKIPVGLRPTLVTAILQSGGLTEFADLEHVRVLRLVGGKSLVEEVNVQAILKGDAELSDEQLSSDLTLGESDIVIVPPKEKATNTILISGNVQRPGPQLIPSTGELTVYEAILQSGGFARFANPKKVFVLRDAGGGVKIRIPVNVGNVKKGIVPDFVLRGGDIVVVPERFFSF